MVKIGVYAVAAVLSFSGGHQLRLGQLGAICECCFLQSCVPANIALFACTAASYVCGPRADRSRDRMPVGTGRWAFMHRKRARCRLPSVD